jgi:hypothetical protein
VTHIPSVAHIHDAEIVVERVNPPAQPARSAAAEPAHAGSSTPADPFAALPRIRPFSEVDLDPAPEPHRTTAVPPRTGRHATSSEEPVPNGGGRRHRVDGDGNDVLSRILARESQR